MKDDARVGASAAAAHVRQDLVTGHGRARPPTAGANTALNMQIRRVAAMLPGALEHEFGFSCECGCSEIVRLTGAAFDREGGAWFDGHPRNPQEVGCDEVPSPGSPNRLLDPGRPGEDDLTGSDL